MSLLLENELHSKITAGASTIACIWPDGWQLGAIKNGQKHSCMACPKQFIYWAVYLMEHERHIELYMQDDQISSMYDHCTYTANIQSTRYIWGVYDIFRSVVLLIKILLIRENVYLVELYIPSLLILSNW